MKIGLVDALGGIQRAIAIAKQSAKLEEDTQVRVIEISRTKGSPLDMLKVASISAPSISRMQKQRMRVVQLTGALTNGVASTAFLAWGILSVFISKEGFGYIQAAVSVVLGSLGLLSMVPKADDELWEYTMEDIRVTDTKTMHMLPQAFMDTDTFLASKSIAPPLKELLKKLL